MEMQTRKKKYGDKLPPVIVAFCEYYAEHSNSLEAYNISHKHVNKVRASNLLSDPLVWKGIIEAMRTIDHQGEWELMLIKQTDSYISKHNIHPMDDYLSVTNSPMQSNPISSLTHLMVLWDYFEMLNRNKFLSELKSRISTAHSHFIKLKDLNPKYWEGAMTDCKRVLRKMGVVSDIEDVLNHDVKDY